MGAKTKHPIKCSIWAKCFVFAPKAKIESFSNFRFWNPNDNVSLHNGRCLKFHRNMVILTPKIRGLILVDKQSLSWKIAYNLGISDFACFKSNTPNVIYHIFRLSWAWHSSAPVCYYQNLLDSDKCTKCKDFLSTSFTNN